MPEAIQTQNQNEITLQIRQIAIIKTINTIFNRYKLLGNNERRGKELHEEELKKYIENCPNKILDLAGKSPDAIEAVIENGKVKLIAVEVLPSRFCKSKNSYKKTFSYAQKEYSYRMFDEVKILTYKIPIKN